MAWKRQRTSQSVSVDVDVDLGDFSENQLLQALIDAQWISEGEAEAIEKRAAANVKNTPFLGPEDEELLEAKDQMRRGNRSEALIHLERFLGRDWIGALQ